MRRTNSLPILPRALSPEGPRARLLVFCFHRVLRDKDMLRLSEPDAREFKRDVEIIGRLFNVLHVKDAARRLVSGDLPGGAACITFDDGYGDNHELAAPILEQAGLPATFFVAADAIDSGVMWNDLVLETLAKAGSDSRFDVLPIDFERSNIDRNISVGAGELLNALKYLPAAERMEYAKSFYSASTGDSVPRLMMNRDQVRSLAARGFEVGGHTLSHPILNRIDDAEAKAEIEGCREWINAVTGTRPLSFAYPNGIPGTDFSPRHERLVRDAGFICGVNTHWSAARTGTNPFSVPRVGPWWRLGFGLRSGMARVYLSSYLH
jgi:peptidoglycan/xylan/chitin deacetylase (PgdA/CDA1 family)